MNNTAREGLRQPVEWWSSNYECAKSRCRSRGKSRQGDTTYPLGESGCNKSPNQVDIWRMERWNWFLAASKSRACQDGGERFWGEGGRQRCPRAGERRMPDRFPTGFMPLFFTRFAPPKTAYTRRRDARYLPARRFSQARAPPSFRCAFRWRILTLPRDINATKNTAESFN